MTQTIFPESNDRANEQPENIDCCTTTADNLTCWVKEECLSREKKKLVTDKKSLLCKSLKQLEMDHTIFEESMGSPESSCSVPTKRKFVREIGYQLTSHINILPFDEKTPYHTRRLKSIEAQPEPDRSRSQNIIPRNSQAKYTIKPANANKLRAIEGYRIDPKQLRISKTVLGEGQLGTVRLATYRGMLVACKSKRFNTHQKPYEAQARRELEFAAKLSLCRYINKYLGWILCPKHWVEPASMSTSSTRVNPARRFYMIQNYVANGDARTYLNKRSSVFQPNKRSSVFQPQEVLQASICLFSALTDAHSLNIGILDLKLENFLIDASGSGWLTDFGSCIEFKQNSVVKLDDLNLPWTKNVASPEMLRFHEFSKASDVFMAIVIIAEMMTADLSDQEFSTEILHRHRGGRVSFSSEPIHKRYSAFFPLLDIGFSNEPTERPTARAVLEYLVKMKN